MSCFWHHHRVYTFRVTFSQMPLSIAHLLAHRNATFLALVACPHSSFTFIYNPLLCSEPAVKINADFLSLSPRELWMKTWRRGLCLISVGRCRYWGQPWEPSSFHQCHSSSWKHLPVAHSMPMWGADNYNAPVIRKSLAERSGLDYRISWSLF